MHPIAQAVSRRGNLAATHELHADGHSRAELAHAVRTRAVFRVRQGWYILPDVHPHLRETARVGGRATCLTGLRLHGGWAHPDSFLHVAVPANACRLRGRRDSRERLRGDGDTIVHWRDSTSGERLLLPPFECIADLVNCQPRETVLAAADSVLHNDPAARAQWPRFLLTLPAVHRAALARLDGVCESGTETLTWHRLSALGIRLRRQVPVSGIGRVDFVVGERLVIEVDGLEYHVDPVRFEADRRRDARLSARGYRVLRFSYFQVMTRWYEVEAAVLAAVSRCDHLR
ncbi:hypothetical protein BH10ACT7_BH10ACT7_17550 [soil metagenome]